MGDQKMPKRQQVIGLPPISQPMLPQARSCPVTKCYLVLFLAGLLGLLPACRPNPDLTVLRSMLTSDHWMIESGKDMLYERYVYTFHTNGAYQACVFSQFGTRPMKGTWNISEDKQGRIHLHIENDEAYYYFLWRDSFVRYKKESDTLLVSGPQYRGEKELRRTLHAKGVTNAPPAVKLKAEECPHWRRDRHPVYPSACFYRAKPISGRR